MTKIANIHTVFALEFAYKLIVRQMDVKFTFLNCDLDEEIYIYAATTKVHSFGQENKVCKLIRSLYNLKQYVKSWYEKFHKTILSFGFIVNRSDSIVCALKSH